MQSLNQISLSLHRKVILAVILIFASGTLTGLFSERCYASGFDGEEANIGNIIQALALGGGAVGLAWSGIEFAYGDEQRASKAKTRMITIIIATAAVFALPYVIRMAQEMFESGAWSPNHLNTD